MKKILILMFCVVMLFAAGSVDSMAQLDGSGNAPDFILTDVFPNPAIGEIVLSFPENIVGRGNLSLHNMAGQVILKESGIDFSSKKTINLSAFPNGIFFLRIAFANQIITKKILIHK